MRVFHLIKGLGRGGAETLLVAALRQQADRRPLPAFGYLLPHKDPLAGDLRALGAEVVCFPAPTASRLALRIPQVAAFLKRWEADVLHCHLPLAGVVGRIAGRMAGVPVVYTEHNLLESYHPWTRLANRCSWRWQACVLAVSEEVAASIHRNAGQSVPVRVVRNGVDVSHFHPSFEDARLSKQRLGIPVDAPVVGTVAAFRQQKRLDCWLAAAQQIHLRQPEARFLLVGDGSLRPEMEGLARTLGLADRVIFSRSQAEVRPFLAAMDVFLSSSSHEGLPVAVLEAMAMERPVVATRVGGVPEVVRDGLTGLLVPPGQPGPLAEATLKLLSDADARRETGRRGRELIVADFSVARMVRDIDAAYELAVSRPRRG